MNGIRLVIILIIFSCQLLGQSSRELNSGWQCRRSDSIGVSGEQLSSPAQPLTGFMKATVPGTVLTTLLNNGLIADPFYGMNNKYIPDVFHTGPAQYTYWFVNDFHQQRGDTETWLQFRGINYSCDIFLNGHRLNPRRFYGMFLRQRYNITKLLATNGNNRLAVIVYPPDQPGDPNGGQGGDGTIARSVSHQYVAGWDWIQPARDRNTGIWDKVILETSGSVKIRDPHVVTTVTGKRFHGSLQAPAGIDVSTELINATTRPVQGTVTFDIAGTSITKKVTVPAGDTILVRLPTKVLQQPKLWWPNGYGDQHLYPASIRFADLRGEISDKQVLSVGIRQVDTRWNTVTNSREVLVNGQPVFIKGGNWIISDAMLRFSPERYDAEVRFHRDMNLNLIRIWGGAITERPEFYEACDRYGLLVMQDFWNSGDCNGRWLDPKKKDDQWTRRRYPDDHNLFLKSVSDQVKMLRNHPSLALWCGGNEITPPEDILVAMRDSILPALDGTRYFFEYSNADSMSLNTIGGNGDGPYGIQNINTFWEERTFPFNSEIGSVGVGDATSLRRFIPEQNMIAPVAGRGGVDSVWQYHKYIAYDNHIDAYGKPASADDFAKKAQLVNYDQYRGMMEGFSAHMWEWYTGLIIWKTQNPWTALRGQMYDYYLDPNACLYGCRKGSEPLHVMYNNATGMVMIVNNNFRAVHNIMLRVTAYDSKGKDSMLTQVFVEIDPFRAKKYLSVKSTLDKLRKDEGVFLQLELLDQDKKLLNDNFYWLPNETGMYSGLQNMPQAPLQMTVKRLDDKSLAVTLANTAENPVAFFNRLSLLKSKDGERVLPTFFDDNYVSVLPGQQRTLRLESSHLTDSSYVSCEGWNVPLVQVAVK